MRRTSIVTVSLAMLLAFGWSEAPFAQVPKYSLTGNLRLENGNFAGMGGVGAIPRTLLLPAPDGLAKAWPGATVMQPSGDDPRNLSFAAGQITAPAVVLPNRQGLALANTGVLSVSTRLGVFWPKAPMSLQQFGRSGVATLSMCPGQDPSFVNPSCLTPNSGPSQHGRMRYQAGVNQFGGVGIARIDGTARAWLEVGSPAPCQHPLLGGADASCIAAFVPATPLSSFGAGASFGFAETGSRSATPNVFAAKITALGLVTSTSPLGTSPALVSAITSYGAPWTTGMVTVSVTANPGGPSVFILSGSDNRVAGVGSISLVSGGIVHRTLRPPTVNRGWLNLVVPEPRVWIGAGASLATLVLLVGAASRLRS